jgi:cytoskeleton protein RodZ
MPDRTTGGFGAKLRDARERRGVSLRQIANATKISIAALEALERDDISRLPGGIFSRAFVRSYAVEVGLDPEATIQEFIAQFPNDSVIAGHPTSDRIEDHEAVESERRTAGTFLWLAGVSVPLAGAVVYFATAGRPLIRDVAPPTAASARPSEAPPAAATPPPVPESTPAQPPPPASPSPEPTSAPVTPAAPSSAPAASAVTQTAASPGAAGSAASVTDAADHLAVQLSAARPCWVTAIVDGRKVIDRLLGAGERTTVDVRREMVLTAGDASALALTLNGAEARPLGRTGEVVTARVNLANFKTYLQTR